MISENYVDNGIVIVFIYSSMNVIFYLGNIFLDTIVMLSKDPLYQPYPLHLKYKPFCFTFDENFLFIIQSSSKGKSSIFNSINIFRCAPNISDPPEHFSISVLAGGGLFYFFFYFHVKEPLIFCPFFSQVSK